RRPAGAPPRPRRCDAHVVCVDGLRCSPGRQRRRLVARDGGNAALRGDASRDPAVLAGANLHGRRSLQAPALCRDALAGHLADGVGTALSGTSESSEEGRLRAALSLSGLGTLRLVYTQGMKRLPLPLALLGGLVA